MAYSATANVSDHMDTETQPAETAAPESDELLAAFEGQAQSSRRAMRRAVAVFGGLLAVGVFATLYLTAQRVNEVRAEYLRDDVGIRYAAFGLLTAALVSFAAGRLVRDLTLAASWPSEAVRRHGRLTAVAVPLLAVATHALALVTFSLGYDHVNLGASRYDQLQFGAMEPIVAASLGLGALLLGLRCAPATTTAGRVADGLAGKRRELGLLGASLALLLLTAQVGIYGLDWQPLAALLCGLGLAIVVNVGARPLLQTKGTGPVERVRAFNALLPVWGLGAAITGTTSTVLTFRWAYAAENATRSQWRQLEVGLVEVAVAALLGGVALALVLSSGRVTHDPELSDPNGLIGQLQHRGRKRLIALGSVGSLAAGSLIASGLVGLSAWVALGVGVGCAVVGVLAGAYVVPMGSSNDDEVDEALCEVQRASRQNALSLAAAGAAGLVTALLALLGTNAALDWTNQGLRRYERVEGGLWTFFGCIAAATLVALFVRRRLARRTDAASELETAETGGIFDDSLATAGSMTVRQHLDLAAWLIGIGGKARYQLLDGGGAFCGEAVDQGGFLARLLLGARRRLDITIDDLGQQALRIVRPFVWWRNRAIVSADGRELGRIDKQFNPLLRGYTVRDAQGKRRFELRCHWLFRSRFTVYAGDGYAAESATAGEKLGVLVRQRRPWYLRLFNRLPEPDRFAIELPEQSDLDDRRLLLGALFLVDMTHYPTQSGPRFAVAGTLALAVAMRLLSPGAATADQSPSYGAEPPAAYDAWAE